MLQSEAILVLALLISVVCGSAAVLLHKAIHVVSHTLRE
jgi:hypothetical protein